MDVDRENGTVKGKGLQSEKPGELKIKGQADAEKRRSKWNEDRDEVGKIVLRSRQEYLLKL